MSKKRIVREIDFTGEGHHCALVSKAANGESVLLMKNKVDIIKSDEVKITTSMQTFLKTFFKMWDEEAKELATILGYDPQEWYWDIIGEDTTVELMKAAADDPINLINKNTYENLKKARAEFGKLNRQYEKEVVMTKEVNVDLQKSIDDAVQAALKKEKEKFVEIEKALKDKDTELTELKKAAEKKEKDELTELCKGYSFVEDADKLSESLFLCKSVKGFDVILDTLEKARTAIKASLEKEIGTDEEVDLTKSINIPGHISKTTELLKKRYNKESK